MLKLETISQKRRVNHCQNDFPFQNFLLHLRQRFQNHAQIP